MPLTSRIELAAKYEKRVNHFAQFIDKPGIMEQEWSAKMDVEALLRDPDSSCRIERIRNRLTCLRSVFFDSYPRTPDLWKRFRLAKLYRTLHAYVCCCGFYALLSLITVRYRRFSNWSSLQDDKQGIESAETALLLLRDKISCGFLSKLDGTAPLPVLQSGDIVLAR